MIIGRLRSFIERLAKHERSPKKLAMTFCLGIYIGFSPFIGFHTAMSFLFGWLFTLNVATLFIISHLVNNPWTMVPVYTVDHFFGKWLFNVFNIDGMQWNPVWFESFNLFLKQHTGISGLSLSAFLVGGHLLGIAISVMLYPFIKRVFTTHLSKKMLVNRQ
jgi:uncharacterized protein